MAKKRNNRAQGQQDASSADPGGAYRWNPRVPDSMTPAQFEEFVLDWLKRCGKRSRHEFKATRLDTIEGDGGSYKIDVLVELVVFGGAKVVVLVECKHHSRPVEREDVMVLEAKLRDVGAHKGMFFSTSGFQNGAIKYASAHRIATVVVRRTEIYMPTETIFHGAPKSEFCLGLLATSENDKIRTSLVHFRWVRALRNWLAKDPVGET